MKEPTTTKREDFIAEIKMTADTIPLDEIKKVIWSFSIRIRNLEDTSGKKMNSHLIDAYSSKTLFFF